ncbi:MULTISPECIES: phage protein Gp13 family protein [unclassified Tatumella]|uniref:phage protein Gp13 family protein n=1 Tax=unclassified Tatumella TaxID=2649542 RepID=UPI001BAEBEDE|nr:MULTISPECIES: phage protein Gp13 family protein [unclassified Tatumella]MBS0878862.1 DUF2833 domain-containing protein [Tatumella sp. JGM82]MBS0892371.1 DUF2833 domain-containing protein [Tatumella sp. JGM94]MBS0903460.1 DUF2833 domain-containing protein [Tatumella sp. JGM100]
MIIKKLDNVDYIYELHNNITQEDLSEFEFFKKYVINSDRTFLEHLLEMYNDTNNSLSVILHNNVLLCLGGHDITNGCIFFLTTNENKNLTISTTKKFLKLIKQYRDEVLINFDYVWNYVFKKNQNHIRLLKAINANFYADETFQYFQLFTIRK